MGKNIHPYASDYTSVNHHYKLVNSFSIFAHGVHLLDDEHKLIAQQGARIVHCPTANLFLGSGLFDLQKKQSGIMSAFSSDTGGVGNTLSMFKIYQDTYKIQ